MVLHFLPAQYYIRIPNVPVPTDAHLTYQNSKTVLQDIELQLPDVPNIKDFNKLMSSNGILVVIANIDLANKKLLNKPMITTRGYILVNENEELIHKIENKAEQTILNALTNPKSTFATLKSDITDTLYPFISNLTGRKPIILPIIMDIKKKALEEIS